MSRIRVFCAASLDGFIADADDGLAWLDEFDHEAGSDPGTVSFQAFMEDIGAMLMGRRTLDVMLSFGGDWHYGDIPFLVATSRPLPEGLPPQVIACSGDIAALCAQAKEAAGGKDVYIDGGMLISQALDSGLMDELIVTVAPYLLGKGIPLYAGDGRHKFVAEHLGRTGEMLQVRLTRPAGDA